MKLTTRQKKFADLYIKLGNATEAAIKAGYSEKTAKQTGYENLAKPYLKKYIDEKLKEISSSNIADAEEVMNYLSRVMRGESKSEVVVVEGVGDGRSSARNIKKLPDEKEQLKAAELLSKRYGLLTEKVDLKVSESSWFKETNEDEKT